MTDEQDPQTFVAPSEDFRRARLGLLTWSAFTVLAAFAEPASEANTFTVPFTGFEYEKPMLVTLLWIASAFFAFGFYRAARRYAPLLTPAAFEKKAKELNLVFDDLATRARSAAIQIDAEATGLRERAEGVAALVPQFTSFIGQCADEIRAIGEAAGITIDSDQTAVAEKFTPDSKESYEALSRAYYKSLAEIRHEAHQRAITIHQYIDVFESRTEEWKESENAATAVAADAITAKLNDLAIAASGLTGYHAKIGTFDRRFHLLYDLAPVWVLFASATYLVTAVLAGWPIPFL